MSFQALRQRLMKVALTRPADDPERARAERILDVVGQPTGHDCNALGPSGGLQQIGFDRARRRRNDEQHDQQRAARTERARDFLATRGAPDRAFNPYDIGGER